MLLILHKLKKLGVDFNDTALREKYGVLSGTVGIFLNLLLFAGKLVIALASGSVAIIADALNNLGDAGSSILALLGFKLSGKKPDPEHPFGHGRFEYISGFVISIAIIVMGVELAISSVKSFFNPEPVQYSVAAVIILCASILVKLYMYIYNKKLSRMFGSAAMNATAVDSLSDTISTFSVLISLVVGKLAEVQLDSYAGMLIALFIIYSGIKTTKETLQPLLGAPPSEETVNEIEKIVKQHPPIVGMHDLVIHDYGPGRMMISLHAEIPSDIDVFKAHCIIDDLENELGEKLNCEAVIHFDPIDVNDKELERLKQQVSMIIGAIDQRLSIHDFRYVPGESHTNLLFDVVVPFDVKIPKQELKEHICQAVSAVLPNHNCVIKFDSLRTK